MADVPSGDAAPDGPAPSSDDFFATTEPGATAEPPGAEAEQPPPGAAPATAGAATAGAVAGEADGAPHQSRRQRRRAHAAARRRRWPRRLLIAAVVVLVLVGAGFGGAWWYVNYQWSHVKVVTVHHLKHVKPGEPFNILLVGSDSRSFADTASECKAFGCGAAQGGQRSDVIIVARVVPATRQIEMLSIPRDTWVNIPGNVQYISGQNRINAAFNTGPSLLVQTIEQDFGIPINYFVEVGFLGLEGMVNAINGIYIDFPYPVRDTVTGLNIPTTGCQLVGGVQALALVRSRHLQYLQDGQWEDDYGSDFSRIHNQQAFFRAVVKRLHSEITNPFALDSFISAATHNLTVDPSFTRGLMENLAEEFHNVTVGAIHTETLPTYGPVITGGGAEVLLPAAAADEWVIKAFDTFGNPVSGHGFPASTTSSSASTSTTTTTTAPAAATTAPDTTTTTNQTTVTTVLPVPAGEAPITNTSIDPWTPRAC